MRMNLFIGHEDEPLLALEVPREARADPVGNIQSSLPVVGWRRSSHVPVGEQIQEFTSSGQKKYKSAPQFIQ